MPISDWADLCRQTIVWESNIGRDGYGGPTWGNAQQFQGRRSYKRTRVKAYERGMKGQGAEMVSESQIWILGLPNVQYEDRVYVAGDDLRNVPPILSIERIPDEEGDLYVSIYLGSSNG